MTLKSIANNAEIDTIWETWQETLEPLRVTLNAALGEHWEEWQIPREADADWPDEAKAAHSEWWEARIGRQKGIDASIAMKADTEYLYDKPYEDRTRVRVAGTVESIAPHQTLTVDENDEAFRSLADGRLGYGETPDFVAMILENLKTRASSRRIGKTASRSPPSLPGRAIMSAPRVFTPKIRRAPRRHLHRARIRHRAASRPCHRGARSGGRRIRRADLLRFQLRGPRR